MHCATCAGRSAPNNAERRSIDMTFIMPAIETGTPSSQARRSFIECRVLGVNERDVKRIMRNESDREAGPDQLTARPAAGYAQGKG